MSRMLASLRSLGPRRQGVRPLPDWHPGPLRSVHDVCPVTIPGGRRFLLVIDRDSPDPAAAIYRQAPHLNIPLIVLMQEFTGPGSRVLDLGANVGVCALAAAAEGCEVVAVEASPKHADLLRRSNRANRFGRRMKVVQAAISDRPGELRFAPKEQWGMVAHAGESAPTITVPAITGDALLETVGWNRVDFVKLDIEGSEVAALRGMGEQLSRPDAPVLFFESNAFTLECFGLAVDDLLALLRGFGYAIYRVEFPPEGPRFQRCEPGAMQPEAVIDLLALKPAHEPHVAFRLAPPPTLHDLMVRIVAEARSAQAAHRAHIARLLQHSGPDLLLEPPIFWTLEMLLADPDEAVRQAAGWWAAWRVGRGPREAA